LFSSFDNLNHVIYNYLSLKNKYENHIFLNAPFYIFRKKDKILKKRINKEIINGEHLFILLFIILLLLNIYLKG
jgi:hypothetical protein